MQSQVVLPSAEHRPCLAYPNRRRVSRHRRFPQIEREATAKAGQLLMLVQVSGRLRSSEGCSRVACQSCAVEEVSILARTGIRHIYRIRRAQELDPPQHPHQSRPVPPSCRACGLLRLQHRQKRRPRRPSTRWLRISESPHRNLHRGHRPQYRYLRRHRQRVLQMGHRRVHHHRCRERPNCHRRRSHLERFPVQDRPRRLRHRRRLHQRVHLCPLHHHQ